MNRLLNTVINIVSNSTTPVIMDTVIPFRNWVISGSICTSTEYWSDSIPYVFFICAIVISSPFISLSWFGYHPPVFSSVCWLKFKVFLIMSSCHFIYWSIHAPFQIFQFTKIIWYIFQVWLSETMSELQWCSLVQFQKTLSAESFKNVPTISYVLTCTHQSLFH